MIQHNIKGNFLEKNYIWSISIPRRVKEIKTVELLGVWGQVNHAVRLSHVQLRIHEPNLLKNRLCSCIMVAQWFMNLI